MATITTVACRICDARVHYSEAKLIQIYPLASRLSYYHNEVKAHAKVCNDCYNKIRKMLRMRVDTDAN